MALKLKNDHLKSNIMKVAEICFLFLQKLWKRILWEMLREIDHNPSSEFDDTRESV
jgi:hypothetical protein